MDDTPIIHAFKGIRLALMIVRSDGWIEQCNAAAERLFGHEAGELNERPVLDVLPMSPVAELSAHIIPPEIDAVIRGVVGRKRDGEQMALAVQITSLTAPGHGLRHVLALRDITDELELEQATEAELRRAGNAIKGARIGVFEYDPGADSLIVSDIWRDMLGIPASETEDAMVAWRKRVHPDDLEAALEPLRFCLAGHGERAHCEYRFRPKQRARWRWMRADIAVAQRDGAGKIMRLSGAITDITETKQVEEALRLRNAQFQALFQSAPIGKAIVGLDGAWQWTNPSLCEILGYSEEDLLKTDFQSVTHPDDVAADVGNINDLLAGVRPSYQMEKRYVRPDGSIMWGLLSVGLVRDDNGTPLHFISQIVDVTEQRHLSEMKSEFVATVSHELRTPLTSILSSLELLASSDTGGLSDQARRLISIARHNGEHLNHLVRDILDFERFSHGSHRLAISAENVEQMLEKAILANSAYAAKYGSQLMLEGTDRRLTCNADPDRFQQVMANLLSNASRFSDEGRPVVIRAERDKDHVRVSVTNEGKEIPPEQRSYLFLPFTLGAPSSTRSRGGTGLGLSICKKLVTQMGGEIGFSSEGGKTTFWFTIPAGAPGPHPMQAAAWA